MLYFEICLNEKYVLHKQPPCGFHKYDIAIIGFEIYCVLSHEENEVSMNWIGQGMKAGGQIKDHDK